MKIEIHHYLSCSHLLESEPQQWDSIVILDSSLAHSQFVEDRSRRSLQLTFDDITAESHGKIAPDLEQIKSAIKFGLSSDKLIVCCRAGQSRSSATAFTILFERFGEKAAIELLNSKRHSPNYLILKFANNIIERPGLLEAYDAWGVQAGDVRLIDFIEEIESEYDCLESRGAKDRIGGRK